MRKVQPPPQYDWPVWVGVSLICPLLALCSLYLAGDYFTLLRLPRAPDFCSQNILKANFVCLGPALLILSIEGNKKLFFPQAAPLPFATPIVRSCLYLTPLLLLTANTLILVLHFTLFSPDRYIRCCEPYPWGTWYYAKTADICVQHGLAPVQNLAYQVAISQ